jgi:predicted nuclease of predicted toxin-antitoxin system
MARASDGQILDKALADGRIVVTLDSDFYALLASSGARCPSVIRFRMERLQAEKFESLLREVANTCRVELENGAVVSIQPERIRVRSLPL